MPEPKVASVEGEPLDCKFGCEPADASITGIHR
jgi:hypothetical protein